MIAIPKWLKFNKVVAISTDAETLKFIQPTWNCYCQRGRSPVAEHINIDWKQNKTAGCHRHIFRPPIFTKMLFRRLNARFFPDKYSYFRKFSNFSKFNNFLNFWLEKTQFRWRKDILEKYCHFVILLQQLFHLQRLRKKSKKIMIFSWERNQLFGCLSGRFSFHRTDDQNRTFYLIGYDTY